MSDSASPIKKKKEKKKEKKERKGDKKSKKEKGGEPSSNDNNDQSNPPSTPTVTAKETPRLEEASPERIEFEQLFKRILHDEIADNRLAFALSMVTFGLNHDELAGVWLKEYKKAVQDEKSGLRPPVKNPLPLRQLQFLREWVTVFEPTFSLKTIDELLDAMKEGKDPSAHISEFKELFAKHNTDGRGEPKEYPILASFPKINAVPVSVYQSIMGLDGATERPSVDILAGVSPNTLAKQLTALEHQLLQTVRADEMVGLTWTKFPERTPNLLNVTTQFNRVSYWVATEIVLTSSAREQAALVKKFVQVCKECITLNNFNTCMEILSGLNHVAVQRLKRMWEKVPTGTMNLFKSLEDIMTTQQNFSNYREKISQCTPPALPYLGVYLKDLTFIYDGNLKYTPEGRINFDLFNLVYERWKNLNQYQSVPYATLDKIKFDNLLETLGAYDHHNEDLLYEMSLQAQPSIWANRPLDSSDRNFALQSASDISILDELEDSTSREGSGRDIKTLEDPKTDSSDDLTLEKRHLGRKASSMDPGTEDSDEGSSSSHAGPRQKRLAKAAVFAKKDELVTVKVPPNLVKTYIKAESIVDRYFAHCYQSKKFGTIEIFDQRYLLLRAPSLSVDFVSTIHKDLEWLISQADATKFANKLLFDFAYTLGKSDAHNFAQRMKAEGKNLSAQQILFAEPMVLSYLGWSFADVHKGMNVDPANPKDFYMCFDRTYSFEASAWNRQIEEKKNKPKHAICIMSCGYTSGWSSDAHGTNLLTVEVLCKAKGDPTCTFITAHSECIEAHVDKFCNENKLSRAQKKIIHIPDLNMVGKKDKKKKTATASILGKKSPKVDLKDKEARERGKTKGTIETYEPVQLPSFKPDDKTMKNINRMQRIQLKGTKLAFALFQGRVCDTARGTVEINKEPYVFLRAKAMSVEFFPLMQALYPTGEKEAALEFATKFLLDFGISLGKADFKHYVNKMKLGQAPPTYHILALPRILAELGWGQMDIDFKTARLSQTEKKVFLKYKLKRSAEALAWKEERHQHPNTYADMKAPACVMHCGYMNGYVTECFTEKSELAVVEVCCEGRGDLYCEFLVAHRQKIGKLIAGYYQAHELPAEKIQSLEVLRLLDERSKKSKKAIKADNWGF